MMMDLNTTITRGDSTHYDPMLPSSTSRPMTPTNLFDFELGNILFLLKFIYSEKATKFNEIFNLPLLKIVFTLLYNVKTMEF